MRVEVSVLLSTLNQHYRIHLWIICLSNCKIYDELAIPQGILGLLEAIVDEDSASLDLDVNELVIGDPTREKLLKDVKVPHDRSLAKLHIEDLLPWLLEEDLRELQDESVSGIRGGDG
jgi:hypothetical protein